MSSPRAAPKAKTSKTAASKTAAPKAVRKSAKSTGLQSAEPSKTEKAAFLRAMAKGIKPGSLAAEKSASKKTAGVKAPAGKTASAKQETPKVEILRKISGNAGTPATPESVRALAFAKELESALADGKIDLIQPHALQALLGALCKVYAANEDAGNRYPILAGRAAVTGTDVMIVCGALLKAVDLQVFELGMWQSWAGR